MIEEKKLDLYNSIKLSREMANVYCVMVMLLVIGVIMGMRMSVLMLMTVLSAMEMMMIRRRR